LDDKDKTKFFFDVRKSIEDDMEEWMSQEDKMELVIDKIVSIVPYCTEACFYLKKDDGSFQIETSSEGILPHRVEEDGLCSESIFKREDKTRTGEVEFNSVFLSEISVILYDSQQDLPTPIAVFYAVSDKKEAFNESDIKLIRDVFSTVFG